MEPRDSLQISQKKNMPLSPIQSHLNSARMSNPNYFRCNIYAVQQDTQSVLMSLFITYVSSTCFGPHRSIIRSVLQAVFAVLVCGNTRTTRHVE